MKFFLVATLSVALLIASQLITRADAQTRPNVVVIISDDQAWTDYGFTGHADIQTPHLDQLAGESVLFRRGYVPTALCRPSLLSLATGRYAHDHGVTGNDPSPKYADPESDLYRQRRAQLVSYIDQFDTLPELLAERGYLSLQTGKWWEGDFRRGGFTNGMSRGFPEPGGRHGDTGLQIGRDGLGPLEEFIDRAIEQEKPFLVWYAPMLPHTPHNPPNRLLEKYEQDGRPLSIARYYAMCEWFDETCGQLIKLIDDKGLRENTLIVYVTDNGWIQNPQARGYALRSKQTPYESGVRTPIMFCWPDTLEPADRTELVSSIDLVPTILAAADARTPNDLPGLNLLPHVKNATPIPRDTIFGESFAHDIADIENPEASLLFRWCVEDNWKLILTYDGEVNRHASTHPRAEKRPQLFDLATDPAEAVNLAANHPEVVARMVEKIGEWYPVRERDVVTEFK
ncbi:MAG: sulfatase family protein [Pirellulaceae bacterium]